MLRTKIISENFNHGLKFKNDHFSLFFLQFWKQLLMRIFIPQCQCVARSIPRVDQCCFSSNPGLLVLRYFQIIQTQGRKIEIKVPWSLIYEYPIKNAVSIFRFFSVNLKTKFNQSPWMYLRLYLSHLIRWYFMGISKKRFTRFQRKFLIRPNYANENTLNR